MVTTIGVVCCNSWLCFYRQLYF